MFIFDKKSVFYVYIHIPKNGGKEIRNELIDDTENIEIISLWGYSENNNLDYAHIPYILRKTVILNNLDHIYFSYSRNPYNRIISAFFYINPDKDIDDFKEFVITTLPTLDFPLHFIKKIIHYYPQYLFVCDENLNMGCVSVSKLEDREKNREKIKTYNLANYFTNEGLEVVNNVYEKDFLYFDYPMITDII